MKYILGIDFGDGETVAAYTDITDPSGEIKYANIKQANTAEGKKIWIICLKILMIQTGVSMRNNRHSVHLSGMLSL